MTFKKYSVSGRDKKPLLEFILGALKDSGCRVISSTPESTAPFQISFELPDGRREGIIVYAFYANSRTTRNRPIDEYRFQVKYGPKDGRQHEIWQDPFGLYTTLFVGINPSEGFFVGADPTLHNPTKFFISIEFKKWHVEKILEHGWFSWERDRKSQERPVETLVGGTRKNFLRFVHLEKVALKEDQGHRQYLAESLTSGESSSVHKLSVEFGMPETEVFDLIEETSRLKMAVRGAVAERHLLSLLKKTPGVVDAHRILGEGKPDIAVRFRNGPPILIECKNTLRQKNKDGLIRLDFQRTRASKTNPCSRYYSSADFDIIAGCTHSVTEKWEFRFALTSQLRDHPKCKGKLDSNVRLDSLWESDVIKVLEAATTLKAREK